MPALLITCSAAYSVTGGSVGWGASSGSYSGSPVCPGAHFGAGSVATVVSKSGSRVGAPTGLATIQASTETTFYVLAVYFGSVGVRRMRHAVIAGLGADAAGAVGAVLACQLLAPG